MRGKWYGQKETEIIKTSVIVLLGILNVKPVEPELKLTTVKYGIQI